MRDKKRHLVRWRFRGKAGRSQRCFFGTGAMVLSNQSSIIFFS
jgi:hypothetical protein